MVVWDGHDGSRTLSVEDIPPRPLIQGKPTPVTTTWAKDHYDGLMFIGQHAKAGTRGLLSHSQSLRMRDITIMADRWVKWVRGRPSRGTSRSQRLCSRATRRPVRKCSPFNPRLKLWRQAIVGKASALSLSHAEARTRIREAARRAVQRIREFRPWVIEGPVEMRFEFHPKPHPREKKEVPRGLPRRDGAGSLPGVARQVGQRPAGRKPHVAQRNKPQMVFLSVFS